MSEFEEIGHTGGRIEIKANSFTYKHSNPTPCTLHEILVLGDGTPIGYIPAGGIGQTVNTPIGTFQVLLVSDREGFFGRICPTCKQYFRSQSLGPSMHCPYCGHTGGFNAFFTANQLSFTRAVMEAYLSVTEEKEVTIDLDQIINNLPENKSNPFVYSEERQQRRVKCKCTNVYDILGEYGFCPYCKKRNSLQVFEDKFQKLEDRLGAGQADPVDILKNCISDFEGFANDLRDQLLRIPATKKRKTDLSNINFQNVLDANEKLKTWFELDFLGVSDEDKIFLNRSFNRRHLFTHKSGVVDQVYLDRTGDTTVRLGQRLSVSLQDAQKVLGLAKVIGRKLFSGYESIS